MLLSFEPLDEICIVSGSRIAALYYTDRVTAILPARAKSRAYLEALEQALDSMPIETFWERARNPNG